MPREISEPSEATSVYSPLTPAQWKKVNAAQRHWSYKTGLIMGITGGVICISEAVHHASSNPQPIHSVLMVIGGVANFIGQGLIIYSADKKKGRNYSAAYEGETL